MIKTQVQVSKVEDLRPHDRIQHKEFAMLVWDGEVLTRLDTGQVLIAGASAYDKLLAQSLLDNGATVFRDLPPASGEAVCCQKGPYWDGLPYEFPVGTRIKWEVIPE